VISVAGASLLWVLRGGVRRPGLGLAALFCAGVAGLPLLPPTMVERLFDPTHFRESDSLIARTEMQVYGTEIGMEHGFVGVGYGCYGVVYEATARGRYVEQTRWMLARDEYSAYDLGDVGAHNTYLEVWVEQGVIGLLLVFGTIASMAAGLLRRNRALPKGSLDRNLGLCCEAGLFALIASTIVIHMQEAPMPWIWLGLAFAWLGLPRAAAARQ
jgi:O-antigen ligase